MANHTSRLVYLSNFKFNKIIQFLTYSDSLLWGGYYMMNAIVAVYLKDKIKVEPLEVIAMGFSIYMLSRSIFQIPIAQYLDKIPGFKDEAVTIFISCVIMAISIFSYQFITEGWHLYIVQFIFGIGTALNMPAWRKTFAQFVDKGHEGMEYSIYDIIANTSVGILTAFGGYLVSVTGNFNLLFTLSAFFIFLGGVVALFMLNNYKKINTKK